MNYTGDIQTISESPPAASAIMTRNETLLRPGTHLMDAMAFLIKHKLSGAPVVDEQGRLLGMLTEKDCLKLLAHKSYYHQQPAQDVEHYMSTGVKTVTPETDIYAIVDIFLESAFRKIPVIDRDEKVVGQISRKDVLRAVQKLLKKK